MLKEIELPYVSIRYEDPIIHLVFKKNVELGFPETRELISCCEKLTRGKPYLILSDARGNVRVTPEGRKIAADTKEATLHIGTALLVNSNMFKLGINFFHGIKKPLFPYRTFIDKQKAIDWLLKLPLVSTEKEE